MDDDENMTPDEIAALIAAALEATQEEEIQPTPWSNLDSSAVVFMFGANMAIAAGEMFRHMALLALGQSAQDFEQADSKAMNDTIMKSLGLIPEAPEKGDNNG